MPLLTASSAFHREKVLEFSSTVLFTPSRYRIVQLLFGSKLGSAEYWKYFMARDDGVHAFGYNSAESEPMWTKSGAL